jgi:hypothetical protein
MDLQTFSKELSAYLNLRLFCIKAHDKHAESQVKTKEQQEIDALRSSLLSK